VRHVRAPTGEILDQALVLWFEGPHSFTGEDVCELHVHGGAAIIRDVVAACLAAIDPARGRVRLAQAGEFTRRACEAGKFDLSAAEGLADLIDAETSAQRRQALLQMQGALAGEVQNWRAEILDALTLAEGDIDFPDEDLPQGLDVRARARIVALRELLLSYLADAKRAVRIRDGFRVAILGAPNAGKSSLLNALARREAAIVSPIAGTTRDIIEVRLVLSGLVIWLCDTAGLHAASDAIEREGIKRARALADEADLRIGLINAPEDQAALADMLRAGDIWVRAKADVIDWPVLSGDPSEVALAVSSVTGVGLEDLEAAIVARASADLERAEAPALTRLRHQEAVRAALSALDRALAADASHMELCAEDLRLAARHLGDIIGVVGQEEILDRIFAQFCIGK
jgi:tRNA modification GTPase